jgi:hypothetical protein
MLAALKRRAVRRREFIGLLGGAAAVPVLLSPCLETPQTLLARADRVIE